MSFPPPAASLAVSLRIRPSTSRPRSHETASGFTSVPCAPAIIESGKCRRTGETRYRSRRIRVARAFESPDGSNLYYLTASIVSPVWRLPASGGEPVKILDGVVWFNFCLRRKRRLLY